jgi:serine/threonine-protein phosphatase PGAM5
VSPVTDRLLYLVRHGDCERGPDLPDGNHDGALTSVGRQQAQLLGRRLASTEIGAIHHSTLARAAETARLVAEHLPGARVHPSDLLRECIPTVPDRADLTPTQAAFFDGFADHPYALTDGPAQAETAFGEFGGTKDGVPELLVTHGNLIRWFATRVLGAPAAAWLNMVEYAGSLTAVLFRDDGPDRLVVFNDTGHLTPPLRGTEYPEEWRV